jgi:NADPH:quinone reductase-like Zn-dependent oxidoreductase
MRAYELRRNAKGFGELFSVERPAAPPGSGEVAVRVRAASLNFRDLLVMDDGFRSLTNPFIPLSDGAGEVVEVGAGVASFKPGDRVVSAFSPEWRNGPFEPRYRETLPGGGVDGFLADRVVVRADALISLPASLTFEQAATLPCAAVTAWNALFEANRTRPGESVLVQGTGGVSLFALQLARAAGARVVVTSSSDDKLARARALGAEHGINYVRTPEWGREVARVTAGGVANTIELGGAHTLAQSVEATRVGGSISLIGTLAGQTAEVDVAAIYRKGLHVKGIDFGSRAMLSSLIDAVAACHLEPVIDRVFPFDEAVAAYRYFASRAHFGKVVVHI